MPHLKSFAPIFVVFALLVAFREIRFLGKVDDGLLALVYVVIAVPSALLLYVGWLASKGALFEWSEGRRWLAIPLGCFAFVCVTATLDFALFYPEPWYLKWFGKPL
jgi:hypothetical protein